MRKCGSRQQCVTQRIHIVFNGMNYYTIHTLLNAFRTCLVAFDIRTNGLSDF